MHPQARDRAETAAYLDEIRRAEEKAPRATALARDLRTFLWGGIDGKPAQGLTPAEHAELEMLAISFDGYGRAGRGDIDVPREAEARARMAVLAAKGTVDCAGCQQPIEGAGYDPGHNFGCGYRRTVGACHESYCDQACFDAAAERSADRAASGEGR